MNITMTMLLNEVLFFHSTVITDKDKCQSFFILVINRTVSKQSKNWPTAPPTAGIFQELEILLLCKLLYDALYDAEALSFKK